MLISINFKHAILVKHTSVIWIIHVNRLAVSQAAVSIKISTLLIFFCSFELSCPVLKKDNFIKDLYNVLSCLIK